MADNFKPVQAQPFSLAGAGAIAGAVSVTLKSFLGIDGVPLVMANFGLKGFGTLQPDEGTSEEQISFSGVVQNANGTATLTGVKTVLFISPYTEVSGLAKTHPGSTTFVISNTSGFYNQLDGKDNDETITGVYMFTNPNYPRMDTATPPPTDDEQLVTKKYVDDLVIAGAPDASTTVKGISKLSVAPASPTDPIAAGTNDPRIPTQSENDALIGTSGTPSNTNKYETENDTSNAAAITVTTISFTAPSTITDSGNGFITAGFRVGDSIIITGSALNNGTYTLTSVFAGVITVAETSIVAEGSGGSDTITAVTANKVVRYSSTSQVKVPLVPVSANDSASKSYIDTGFTSTYVSQSIKIATITLTAVSVPSSAFTTIADFTGLTGDTDDEYFIQFEFLGSNSLGSNAVLALRFNNDSTSNHYSYTNIFVDTNVGVNTNTSTQIRIAGTTTGTSRTIQNVFGSVQIKASKTIAGTGRLTISEATGNTNAGANTVNEKGTGTWTDTTNQITSIEIVLFQDSGSSRTIDGVATIYKIQR